MNSMDQQELADRMFHRLRALIQFTVNNLDEDDRDRRIQWCREHNQHGVHAQLDQPGEVVLWWAGRRLAVISSDVLTDADPRVNVARIEPVPDHVPPDWTTD